MSTSDIWYLHSQLRCSAGVFQALKLVDFMFRTTDWLFPPVSWSISLANIFLDRQFVAWVRQIGELVFVNIRMPIDINYLYMLYQTVLLYLPVTYQITSVLCTSTSHKYDPDFLTVSIAYLRGGFPKTLLNTNTSAMLSRACRVDPLLDTVEEP